MHIHSLYTECQSVDLQVAHSDVSPNLCLESGDGNNGRRED